MTEPNSATRAERLSPASSWILAIAARRDRTAFASLFAYFAPRLKAYLMRLGSSAEAAEDLVQETMLTVWRRADYFNPSKADASTWIFTISRNLRVSQHRRQRWLELGGEEAPITIDTAPLPIDSLAAEEAAARLRAAIATLPPEQAEVVRLSYYDDKVHREIEATLGVPLGTVKSRLRLAMAKLRAALGGEDAV